MIRKPSFFPNRAAIGGRIVDNAKVYSRSHHAVIRVCDEDGNVIDMTNAYFGSYVQSFADMRTRTGGIIT